MSRLDFKVSEGDAVGEANVVTTLRGDTRRIRVDFSQGDLEVVKIERGVNRVLYYEVRLRTVDGVKRLVMEAKNKLQNVVTLRSRHTGVEFVLPQLQILRAGRDNFYPHFEGKK